MNPSDQNNPALQRLERENQRLRRAVDELSILNEIATAISSTQSLEDIIQLMVQKCVKHLHVEQAAVSMLDRDMAQQSKLFQTMVRQVDTSHTMLPYRLDTQLTGWMLKNRQPLLINDLVHDKRFHHFNDDESSHIHSLISVPLLNKGEIVGILSAFNKKTGDLTIEDQRLLAIIATQSSQVIENARLLAEQQALIKVREEMRMAREIQVNLLPKAPPQVSGYDISAKSIPAREVGGDFFDFIERSNDKLIFCLGDGTGKGLPAAMLVANLQACIRSLAIMDLSPKDFISHANRLLYESTDAGKFVTFFMGLMDYRSGTFTYCNAGHDAPFVIRNNGERSQLDVGGVVLGFVPVYVYEEETISLASGDRLIIYSDGITEAMNGNDEEFSDARLMDMFAALKHLTAKDSIDQINTTVKAHAGDTPQSDDMTLMILDKK